MRYRRVQPVNHRAKVRAAALGLRPGHAFTDKHRRRKAVGRKPRGKK